MSFGPELQDPQASALYRQDWALWLGDATIAESEWMISPDPSSVVLTPIVTAGAFTGCRISGIEFGKTYSLTNRVTASDGAVDERTIIIRGGNR